MRRRKGYITVKWLKNLNACWPETIAIQQKSRMRSEYDDAREPFRLTCLPSNPFHPLQGSLQMCVMPYALQSSRWPYEAHGSLRPQTFQKALGGVQHRAFSPPRKASGDERCHVLTATPGRLQEACDTKNPSTIPQKTSTLQLGSPRSLKGLGEGINNSEKKNLKPSEDVEASGGLEAFCKC